MMAIALRGRLFGCSLKNMGGRKAGDPAAKFKSDPTMTRIHSTVKSALLTAAFALLPCAAVSA